MSQAFLYRMLGFAVFLAGGVLHMYMVIRVRGLRGYFSSSGAARKGYRSLVEKRCAPLWPLPVSLLCTIGGIIIMFISVILSPK